MVESGLLCEYDYKKDKDNIQHYGQAMPPSYNITKIDPNIKIYLYWSSSDWLADEQGKNLWKFLENNL
jgi:lysosomal acid lipase/cholesteryl ester hydrolase